MMGHVTWAGKSSVEATLQLFQCREGEWVHVTDATFVMVVRDPLNKGWVHYEMLVGM
jgi:acyl-CoA hydrolase